MLRQAGSTTRFENREKRKFDLFHFDVTDSVCAFGSGVDGGNNWNCDWNYDFIPCAAFDTYIDINNYSYNVDNYSYDAQYSDSDGGNFGDITTSDSKGNINSTNEDIDNINASFYYDGITQVELMMNQMTLNIWMLLMI